MCAAYYESISIIIIIRTPQRLVPHFREYTIDIDYHTI